MSSPCKASAEAKVDSCELSNTHNTCIHCGFTNQLTLNAFDLALWRSGELIQYAFPQLDYKQRELIQTGIHPECWDEMFPKDEE